MYLAFAVALVFSMVFAHIIMICNVAIVIFALEEVSGPQLYSEQFFFIRGKTHVRLLIYLRSTIGMAFMKGLF